MIKSEKKEYLLEFSKIDIKQEIDLSNEKKRLIELKRAYDIYKESEFLLESFIKQIYMINIYMNNECRFIVASQKDLKGDDIRYCFSLEYKLNEKNLLFNFLTEKFSLEYFLEVIKNLIFNNFVEIKFNLIRDLIIKDVLYWCDQFDKYPFLIYIVNIEDFYNFIGRYVFFDHTNEYERVQYSRGVELMHYKIGYASNNTGSLTTFIKERSKEKDLYAKLIYNQYQTSNFNEVSYSNISSFLIYAIYNELISDKTIDNVLRMKSNYLFNFIIKIFYSNTEILNKLIKYIPKDDPIIYYTNTKHIYTYECISQLIYIIEIEKKYFLENRIDVLLKISKLLIQGNKIKIAAEYEKNYIIREIIRDCLVENISIISKILNITPDKLEQSIVHNLLR